MKTRFMKLVTVMTMALSFIGFSFAEKPANPTFAPVTGVVELNTEVAITTTATDATIFYAFAAEKTGDGVVYEEYSEASKPTITAEHLKIWAFARTGADGTFEYSDTVSAEYTIKAAEPTTPPDTVTVTCTKDSWEMGKAAPKLIATIKNATSSSDPLKIGDLEKNVAVMLIMKKDAVADTQIINSSSTRGINMKTAKLTTAGEWVFEYVLVKGNSTSANPVAFEAGKVVVSTASASKLTVLPGTVARPSFSPLAGAVDVNTEVTIKTTTADAKIYYTTDGTMPTKSSTLYENPVVITEATTIKAFAVKDGWTDSPVDSAKYTIAALPEDEEGAPAVTFNPTNADSVDNNTEILVSTTAEDYSIYYQTFSSISEAVNASTNRFPAYGSDGYPAVTEESPILVIVLAKEAQEYQEYKYFRSYKVRKASSVEMPGFMTMTGATGGYVAKGTELMIRSNTEDGDGAIWYTTDGSKPVANGVNSTQGQQDGGANVTINASMIVKAICVKDGVASDVATAHFTIFEDIDATLVPTSDSIGKNVGLGFGIASKALGGEAEGLVYMHPFTIYYTLDGETEPSEDAYWDQKDPENGVIKKVESQMDDEGYPVMDEQGNTVSIIISEGTEVHLKAKGYVMMGETTEAGQLITTTLDRTFKVVSDKDPRFSIAPGSEVKVGDTLVIFNPGADTLSSELYYSFDGTQPTAAAYFAQPMSGPYSVFKSPNYGDNIIIIFGKDEKGYYAQVPSIFELLYNRRFDTIRMEDGSLSVDVLCQSMKETGEMNDYGMPAMFTYGSDILKASYMMAKEIPMPVITPNGGEVEKGTEVEITMAQPVAGAKIYYTLNDSIPVVGKAYTMEYTQKIAIDSAMTIKAMAFKAKSSETGKDSVSNVAVAVFTIKVLDTVKTPTFSIPASEVETGTKVALACATTGAKIYYTTNGSTPTASSTLYSAEIVINEAMTIKAIAIKDGMVDSKIAEAAYTIKEVVVPDTVNTPTFSIPASEVEKGTKVALACATTGAKIYYTTNGSTPTASSTEYTAEIVINETTTIKAIAIKDGMINSKVAEATYTVKVGNEGKELAGVNIYPNPANGEFQVSVPVNAEVAIFAANGAQVKRFTMAAGKQQVSLSASGVYFVRFTAQNGEVAVRRVVIR